MDIGKIGFGTTALLALGSESERQELLHGVVDAGITHFDTAAYYGYGEAEKILGRFIKERRDRVTVTTKFGIQPPRLAGGGGSVAAAVKRLVKHAAPLRSLLARQAGKMVQRGAFTAADAEKSLESSLRALQTDRIDIYLLHEAGPEDVTGELLAFLERKQREGIIGRFGTGSDFAKVLRTAEEQPAFADVLQFENSVLRPNAASLPRGGEDRLFITHGALGGSFRELRSMLQADAKLARKLSEVLGADAADSSYLAAAMLAWAAQANEGGCRLFSSSRIANVRANAQALAGNLFGRDQLNEFACLVEGARRK